MLKLFSILGLICAATLPVKAQGLLSEHPANPKVPELTAEQRAAVWMAVRRPTYKPLTTWESIKLGAAYFTDPKRIQNIQIAYEYDPSQFDPGRQTVILYHLASRDQIFCSFDAAATSTIVHSVPCQNVTDFPFATKRFKIISLEPSLLEKRPTNVLVSDYIPIPHQRPNFGAPNR